MTTNNQALARDLAFTGCGCDDDATDGCPNWNGERCTYAESRIAAALDATEARGRAIEMRALRALIAQLGRTFPEFRGYAALVTGIDCRLASLEHNDPDEGEPQS